MATTRTTLRELERASNEIIAKNLDVKIYEMDRVELEQKVDPKRAHLDLLPESVRRLRVIDIAGFDINPCAGTHVRSTSELGKVKIIKKDNKGKDRERITYILE